MSETIEQLQMLSCGHVGGSPAHRALQHAISALASAGKPVAWVEAAPNSSVDLLADNPEMFPLVESTRIGFGRTLLKTQPDNQAWPLYLGAALPDGQAIKAAMMKAHSYLPDAVAGHPARMRWMGEFFLRELGLAFLEGAPESTTDTCIANHEQELARQGYTPDGAVFFNRYTGRRAIVDATGALHWLGTPPPERDERIEQARVVFMEAWDAAQPPGRTIDKTPDPAIERALDAGLLAVLDQLQFASSLDDPVLLDRSCNAYMTAWSTAFNPDDPEALHWDDVSQDAIRAGVRALIQEAVPA